MGKAFTAQSMKLYQMRFLILIIDSTNTKQKFLEGMFNLKHKWKCHFLWAFFLLHAWIELSFSKYWFSRNDDFDDVLNNEEDLDQEEENALLWYCFADIYGPNFGFRTLVEFNEVCEEGQSCDDLQPIRGSSIDTEIFSEENLDPIEDSGERKEVEEGGTLFY